METINWGKYEILDSDLCTIGVPSSHREVKVDSLPAWSQYILNSVWNIDRYVSSGKCRVLFGPRNVGKKSTAVILANAVLSHGYSVTWVDAGTHLKNKLDPKNTSRIEKVDLLILADLRDEHINRHSPQRLLMEILLSRFQAGLSTLLISTFEPYATLHSGILDIEHSSSRIAVMGSNMYMKSLT